MTGEPTGTWDPARLGQIVQNLVTNAIQHGDPTAGIHVRVDGDTTPDAVTLTVSNRGKTIPPGLIPHLFEPFRRLAAGNEAEGSSLGLGLYIVSEIARAHGGEVAVRSTDEDGTSFCVSLPRQR